jgi:hypothetical protein
MSKINSFGEYDGEPLAYMTLHNLLTHGEKGGIVYYVWPYEGAQHGKSFRFAVTAAVHDGETFVTTPSKPLLIDQSSARAFKLVYEAINDKNRAKVHEYLESRGLTCWMFDQLIWPNVKFGSA